MLLSNYLAHTDMFLSCHAQLNITNLSKVKTLRTQYTHYTHYIQKKEVKSSYASSELITKGNSNKLYFYFSYSAAYAIRLIVLHIHFYV